MSDETPTTPTPDSPHKPSRDNALQDSQQANEIAYTKRMIQTITTKNELKAEIARLGFDDNELANGSALQAYAFNKYSERQNLLAIANQQKAERDAIATKAENELSSYRQTVQALYKGPVRTTLGASGRMPEDQEVFETTARSGYAMALTEPYASKLANRGFSPERTAAALVDLDKLGEANTRSKASQKAAVAATKARNAAVKAMNDWSAELKKVAKANLKQKPEFLALLEE